MTDSPFSDRFVVDAIARALRQTVIEQLIRKAKDLPHHPSCQARHAEPCNCFTASLTEWLEGQQR